MAEFNVTFNVLGAFTIRGVEAPDQASAYQAGAEAFFRFLDGGNIDYQIEKRQLETAISVGDLDAAMNEEECRDALCEGGWRWVEGDCFVRDSDGRRSTAATWAALSAELLAEV